MSVSIVVRCVECRQLVLIDERESACPACYPEQQEPPTPSEVEAAYAGYVRRCQAMGITPRKRLS